MKHKVSDLCQKLMFAKLGLNLGIWYKMCQNLMKLAIIKKNSQKLGKSLKIGLKFAKIA